MSAKSSKNGIDWTLDERLLRKQLLKLTKPKLIKLCKSRKVIVSINGRKQEMINNTINKNKTKTDVKEYYVTISRQISQFGEGTVDNGFIARSIIQQFILKYNIKLIHVLCVHAFIRQEYEFQLMPLEIIHLLIIYYAKPLTFHCRWDSEQNSINSKSGDITYCAAWDDWTSLLIKIGDLDLDKNVQKFKIPTIITINSTNVYGPFGFDEIINSLNDNEELLCSTFEKYDQAPNIKRIALNLSESIESSFKWDTTGLNTKADLLELFQIYLDAEQVSLVVMCGFAVM